MGWLQVMNFKIGRARELLNGENAMKRTFFLVIALLAVGVTAFIFVPTARLQTNAAAPLPASDPAAPATHNDYLNAAENVDVKSEGATGDVVVAGANVKIAGDVQGYVMGVAKARDDDYWWSVIEVQPLLKQ